MMVPPLDRAAVRRGIAALAARTLGGRVSFGEEGPPDGARLVADLGLESVQIVELAGAIERSYGVRFASQDLLALRTVGDLIEHVMKEVASAPEV